MCLILLAFKVHPSYPLILAANRDEFYSRPTRAAEIWTDHTDIIGGRDLQEGGTWLGITRQGRFAALTNYRDPRTLKENAPSRGKLVSRFLTDMENPADYLHYLEDCGERYNGFSLLFGTIDSLYYYCNKGSCKPMSAGIYGLSNAIIDTPWPKVEQGKRGLKALTFSEAKPDLDALFGLLTNQSHPHDDELPETGVGIEWERILSPMFITSPIYGTRSSTVVLADDQGRVIFEERTFQGQPFPWTTARFEFTIGEVFS
ncbi:MAG: hypothetical protein CSYNP_03918 [Syntrophus sp. SKADARSKE-3]|nr:hypothetical protein [Syntrophus sp. SKADARSKE-3]